MRKLGKNQKEILKCLSDPHWRGVWYAGCGWVWGSITMTDRLMRSLEKRGLVSSPQPPTVHRMHRTYGITEDGLSAVQEMVD